MSLDDCNLVFAALNLVLLGYTWTVLQEVQKFLEAVDELLEQLKREKQRRGA